MTARRRVSGEGRSRCRVAQGSRVAAPDATRPQQRSAPGGARSILAVWSRTEWSPSSGGGRAGGGQAGRAGRPASGQPASSRPRGVGSGRRGREDLAGPHRDGESARGDGEHQGDSAFEADASIAAPRTLAVVPVRIVPIDSGDHGSSWGCWRWSWSPRRVPLTTLTSRPVPGVARAARGAGGRAGSR